MQVRGQFSDFFFETALPALNAKIWLNFDNAPRMYNKVLGTETTGRSIEQYSQMAGTGLPALIPETGDTPVDNFVQGFNKTFRPAKYGLGIACSQELVEDDQFGIISRRSVALSNSIIQSIEIQAASVLNNGFTTTGPDGKALFAVDHPLVKSGGTQSNVLAAAADLDVTSLELALTDWETTKTAEGFLQMLSTPRLLVAPANRWNAYEILRSTMRSDTANHTANAFSGGGEHGNAVADILIWKFLTDPDAWFLVAPPDETCLLWLWRKQPYTKDDYIEKNETGYVFMRYRADFGFYDWRGTYGTPGA